MVNNAGMISAAVPVFESGTVESMDLPTWQAALARNLTTAFLVTKAALLAMTSRGWGRIIMVASVTGPVMAIRADAGYATAKAGLSASPAPPPSTPPSTESSSTPSPRLDSNRLPTPQERSQGPATPPAAAAPRRGRRHCLAGQPRRLLHHRAIPGPRRRQLDIRATRHTSLTGPRSPRTRGPAPCQRSSRRPGPADRRCPKCSDPRLAWHCA